MCGVCGFAGNQEGIDRAGMLSALAHRGPDDCGEWQAPVPDGVIWFGHRRLAIIDLTCGGHQPMSLPGGRYTIVFNGEIYNFQEVRAALEAKGAQFRTRSDTEVILAAWAEWGPASLQRFRGMFAFALWDAQERTLWLARDRIGEKPLYYIEQNGALLFASEVRALLATGIVDRTIDSDGLDSYLTFGSVADPYTLIKNVRSVEAGHLLRFADGRLTTEPYWSLAQIPEEEDGAARGEKVQIVADLIRQACQLSSIADVPVAVLLSGGIDSSANVVVLSEQKQQLQTFSVVFPSAGKYNEERWSSMIAGRFNTRHNRVEVADEEAFRWVADAVRSMDQPSWDGVNTYLVCRAIASTGIKVAISGQGADEVFLGYWQRDRFARLLAAAQLPAAWFWRRLGAAAGRFPDLHDTRYEKLLQTIAADEPVAAAYLAEHTIYSQKGLERLRGEKRPPQSRFVQKLGGSSPLNKLSRLELGHYLRNTLLRDSDQMSMSQSLEMRVPFLDYKLVETVVALPANLKIEPNRQKPLLVDAIGPNLPAEIANRPKQGFGLPYERWLREGLQLADISKLRAGLDSKTIKQVASRFFAGQNPSRFWTLQVLAAWLSRNRVAV